jgi:hypothetical protein
LLGALEAVLPVKFVSGNERLENDSGRLVVGAGAGQPAGPAAGAVASLRVPAKAEAAEGGRLTEVAVTFSEAREVPFPFRGRSVRVKAASAPAVLSVAGPHQVLARTERGPVWACAAEAGVKHYASGFALPRIPRDGNLRDVLNGDRFLELLPVLHWLQGIRGQEIYEGLPLRACFMFDDPNLHWPRYGFVDFQQIAEHAARENFHVSFAMIPLDAWFAHAKATEIFRTNTSRLSLLIHGNDHLKRELARTYDSAERVLLLAQAIRRIERFEAKTGLRVCRVMVPPHGACSESTLAALPDCGFEAACISHGSLRAHNRERPWTKFLGFRPSEVVAGCPVMPRWALAGTTNAILLAAYLRQPIVLMGHHQDLRHGIELLDERARFINGLGTVLWSRMTDLSRMNYQWRMDSTNCRLKVLGHKLRISIPAQTTQKLIESHEGRGWENWRVSGVNGAELTLRTGERISLPDCSRSLLTLEVRREPALPLSEADGRPVLAAFVRRLLTEGRDRLLP